MSMQPDTDLTILIRQDGKELLTDTRAVAIAFGKQHTELLSTIEMLEGSIAQAIAASR